MSRNLIFDIETAPLPEDRLRAIIPAFDPEAVKVGNIKDPDKIKAKIDEAEANHFYNFHSKAALDAKFGFVCAFGFVIDDAQPIMLTATDLTEEEKLLNQIAGFIRDAIAGSMRLVGFNIRGFDLPFLVRRMWTQRIPIPSHLVTEFRGRFQWYENVTDMMYLWQLPDGSRDFDGLDIVSKTLTGKGKTGTGDQFWDLLCKDRPRAMEYLRTDVIRTKGLWDVMKGAIEGENS